MDRKMLSEDELDRLLSDRAVRDDETVREALADVRCRIESSATPRAPSRSGSRPGRRRHLVVLGAGVAAVAVAAVAGLESLTGGLGSQGSSHVPVAAGPGTLGMPGGFHSGGASSGGLVSGRARLTRAVSRASAKKLEVLAHVASAQPEPAAGQWLYAEAKSTSRLSAFVGPTTIVVDESSTTQDWYSTNGTSRERSSLDGISFPTPQDKASYEANKAIFDHLNPLVLAPTGLDEDRLPGNPRPLPVWDTSPPGSPQELISEIKSSIDGQVPSQDAAVDFPGLAWPDLASILATTTSAQLRATAFQALKYVPGTTVLGTRTDSLGRSGTAILFNPGKSTYQYYEIIVNPSTGEELESYVISSGAVVHATPGTETTPTTSGLPSSIPAGTVLDTSTLLKQGVVDADTALPGGGSVPISPTATVVSTTPTTSATAVAPATSTPTR